MWKVSQIMQTQVVTVAPDMAVRELVQLFAKARISGAPVVTDEGALLGVVSATDVVALAAYGSAAHVRDPWQDEEGASDEESAWYFRTLDAPFEFESDGSNGMTEFVVEDIMTPAVFSVGPDESIAELARFLLNGRIHRALVVENEKLIGIVTTYDVLQAVAVSEDEPVGSELATTKK